MKRQPSLATRGVLAAGPRTCAPVLALVALVAAACANDAGADGWSTTTVTLPDGVVRSVNTPPPGGIRPTWVLEPEVTIGALHGNGPDVFGMIKSIAPLPDGRIAVLESQAQEIRIFSGSGEHLRTFGGRGAGPGELRDANGMLAGADGLLRVNDPRNARFSLFDPDAGFVASQPIDVSSYGFLWDAAIGPDDRITEPSTAMLDGERWRLAKVYDRSGAWTDTIRIETYDLPRLDAQSPGSYTVELPNGYMYLAVPFWPRFPRGLDPTGYFWRRVSEELEYRIVKTTLRGEPILEFESHRPPLPVTAAERDSAIAAVRERAGGRELDWSRIPSEKPVIEGIFLDDGGRVWVSVRASNTVTTFDVFGPDGVYQGTAVTPLRFGTSLMPRVVGDRFYAVHTDDLDVQHVVQARIRPARPDDLEMLDR